MTRKRQKRESQIESVPRDVLRLIGTYQAILPQYILIIWNWFDRSTVCCKMFTTIEKAEQYFISYVNQKLDAPVQTIEEFYTIEHHLDGLDQCRYLKCHIIESKIDEQLS